MIKTNQHVVSCRIYEFDDEMGHASWVDDYVEFDTLSDAQSYVDELNQRIADGARDIRGPHIVPDGELGTNPNRSGWTV